MTPKEKAQQLIYAFEAFTDKDNEFEFAKQCAAIAVDELIEIACDYSDYDETVTKEYWEKVKIEIENL
jgi:hypothetical protein